MCHNIYITGGMGVEAMEALFYKQADGDGLGKALHTVMSIATGIIFSNMIFPPRKQLKGTQLQDLSF